LVTRELHGLQELRVSMTYEEHRRVLIEYLKAKVELADWHGVSDAANDLRVLEAQHQILDPLARQ